MKIYQVDSFSHQSFKGNPAGVCILNEAISEELMQNIAMEMNLSETAFALKKDDAFQLRWFTPEREVDICGHATLAAGHILFNEYDYPKDQPISFHSNSGLLKVLYGEGEYIMDFPCLYTEPMDYPDLLKKALSAIPTFCSANDKRYLLEFSSEEEIRNLKPDFGLLRDFPYALMVTAASDSTSFDFVSRFFAPCVGIDEDPVTGSAHSYLAPYWAKKLGKKELWGYQISRRTGLVGCRILNEDRVHLTGQAVTVLKGELFIVVNH